MKKLDTYILIIVASVLIVLIILLGTNLSFQYSNYRLGINVAVDDPDFIDHASILAYSRSWDFAVVKTSALFLAYLLIFTGAIYVLRKSETEFELQAENKDTKVSLISTSPGLVMLTLGVFLVAFVIASKTSVKYEHAPPKDHLPEQEEVGAIRKGLSLGDEDHESITD